MSARNCPECGGLVASTIDTCPHCGHYMPVDGGAQQAPVVGDNPHTSLVWCIVAVFLFWPLSLVSFYYYFKSYDCWLKRDQAGAERNGYESIRFAKYSVWAFVISLVLGFSLAASVFGFFSSLWAL